MSLGGDAEYPVTSVPHLLASADLSYSPNPAPPMRPLPVYIGTIYKTETLLLTLPASVLSLILDHTIAQPFPNPPTCLSLFLYFYSSAKAPH